MSVFVDTSAFYAILDANDENHERRFADFLDRAKDVVRYLKNERFGFSITYYQNNRPRQYYPDFIVVSRDSEGRERFWIAETTGEVRHSTRLKREAAELWCQRMSGTAHGSWQYLFMQQRAFEYAMSRGVQTLSGLAKEPGTAWFSSGQ